MELKDFFTEQTTSLITDSQTTGGIPGNTSEAAYAITLLNSLASMCMLILPRFFMTTIFVIYLLRKNMPEKNRRLEGLAGLTGLFHIHRMLEGEN